MSIEFDFSEVRQLSASLGRVPREASRRVRQAVEVSARNVKDDARSYAAGYFGGGSARHYPGTMEYELKESGSGVVAEVGPRPGGQGNFAPLFESGNRNSGRYPSLEPALADNEADFVKGLGVALGEGLDL